MSASSASLAPAAASLATSKSAPRPRYPYRRPHTAVSGSIPPSDPTREQRMRAGVPFDAWLQPSSGERSCGAGRALLPPSSQALGRHRMRIVQLVLLFSLEAGRAILSDAQFSLTRNSRRAIRRAQFAARNSARNSL